jgi:autotransporter passenger strand-loop-strand repeat protein
VVIAVCGLGLCVSTPSLAGNCAVSNGVASGDCGPMKVLEVTGSERMDKVIPGARVKSGGSLDVSGMVSGDVTVERGGYAVIRGSVSGTVINNGGTVEIRGMANRLQANSGETKVCGMVQSVGGPGTVHYVAGAMIGGVRVDRDR